MRLLLSTPFLQLSWKPLVHNLRKRIKAHPASHKATQPMESDYVHLIPTNKRKRAHGNVSTNGIGTIPHPPPSQKQKLGSNHLVRGGPTSAQGDRLLWAHLCFVHFVIASKEIQRQPTAHTLYVIGQPTFMAKREGKKVFYNHNRGPVTLYSEFETRLPGKSDLAIRSVSFFPTGDRMARRMHVPRSSKPACHNRMDGLEIMWPFSSSYRI